MQKRDHSLGRINKNRIWEIIQEISQEKGFDKGIRLTEILRENDAKIPKGLSKPAVISRVRKIAR
jgi:hypothetical protein